MIYVKYWIAEQIVISCFQW